MNHLTETQINDLADGREDAAALEHLHECKHCRAELEQVRGLLAELQGLRAVPPARDLLPGIHAAIAALPPSGQARAAGPLAVAKADALHQPAAHRPPTRRTGDFSWPYPRTLLAAAAILLVVATAVITRALMLPESGARSSVSPLLVNTKVRALEQNYTRAIVELEQLIEQRRAELAPSTVQLLEENLKVIDRAIHESRVALERDPNHPLIGDWLRSAYERKLDLLRRATAAI